MTATPQTESRLSGRPAERPVAVWLLVCCAMIFAMAVIGAITRLTESGLSIMEWAPVAGALPPLSEAEWRRVFALYQEIPEYQVLHRDMTLEEFKTIFWWEYVHRLWGRLIGVVFAVPFLWFWLRGRLSRSLVPHLVAMFVLGGLQGGLGWFMVASGFAERTDVSQYRLVAHLAFALAIYGYVFWIALALLYPASVRQTETGVRGLRGALAIVTVLIAVTVASGGFVAGLDAGFIYNSFPLMDGRLVPAAYGALEPWIANPFDNPAAAQFNHRVLAIVTLLGVVGLWLWSRRLALSGRSRAAMDLVLAIAALQVGLGIAALLLVVPVWLGALHQAGAIALLTAALWALFHLPRSDPITP
jgi:cytochrome c oxidase assembly protein subunit 15